METENTPLIPDTTTTLQQMLPKETHANTAILNLEKQQFTSVKGFLNHYRYEPQSLSSLAYFEQLTTLNLAHNNLKNVNISEFFPLSNLQYLDLSHNQLESETLQHTYTKGLNKLRSLNLSHNQLTLANIGNFFNVFPELKHLDLSHNKIKTVVWAKHPIWIRLDLPDGRAAHSLPTINLIGNQITSDDRNRLEDRYEKEQNLLANSVKYTEVTSSLTAGSLIGTFLSAIPGIPLTVVAYPYGLFAFPIGCILGGIVGIEDSDSRSIENAQIRLYFDEKDTENAAIQNTYMTNNVSCMQWRTCH